MSKKNQKNQKQPEQQTTPQPIAPATPLELSEEELGQVVGGVSSVEGGHATTGIGGLPALTNN